jgi:hypothetical protein
LSGGREVALAVERSGRLGEHLAGLGLAALRLQHGAERQVAVAVQVENVGGRCQAHRFAGERQSDLMASLLG